MNKYLALFLSLFAISVYAQNIPYNQTPDWQSTPAGHIATGLGIADINNDGWKDIVVGNGNDIQRQHLVVYYNQGDGTFPLLPDWQSDDIDFHGHLAVGDINKDGYIDVAVSVYLGPDGFGDPGKVKVYYNQDGQLQGEPSFISEPFYTFSCALGDADGDGDLDLGVACGEPYGELFDHGRIFYNVDGQFSSDNVWESTNQFGALDVDFGDFDDNGYLDIVFASEYSDNYIFLADENGSISNEYGWHSEESQNFMNSLDIGRMGDDELPSIVMTGNNQLGGTGKIHQYKFDIPFPNSGMASWLSNSVGYGSGVLLADVTRDDTLDLIYGGWWKPMEILTGNGENFNTTPAYTSSMSSVVETILMADLGKENLVWAGDDFFVPGNTSIIYLDNQIVDQILEVYKNGVLLNSVDYTYVPNKNWISFTDDFVTGDLISVNYYYCYDGDIVISNWDSGKGNFIYYNTNQPTGIGEEAGSLSIIDVYPNPFIDQFTFRYQINDKRYQISDLFVDVGIFDLRGVRVDEFHVYNLMIGMNEMVWDGSGLKPGVYFFHVYSGGDSEMFKLIKME
jgi:hypothetical protein